MGIKEGTSSTKLANYDFVLRVTKGVDSGTIFALSMDKMIVGRNPMADVEIHEIHATQKHFAIYWDKSTKSHVVIDYGSKNKVFINDHALKVHSTKKLRLGDKIRVGNTTFIYERAMSKK